MTDSGPDPRAEEEKAAIEHGKTDSAENQSAGNGDTRAAGVHQAQREQDKQLDQGIESPD